MDRIDSQILEQFFRQEYQVKLKLAWHRKYHEPKEEGWELVEPEYSEKFDSYKDKVFKAIYNKLCDQLNSSKINDIDKFERAKDVLLSSDFWNCELAQPYKESLSQLKSILEDTIYQTLKWNDERNHSRQTENLHVKLIHPNTKFIQGTLTDFQNIFSPKGIFFKPKVKWLKSKITLAAFIHYLVDARLINRERIEITISDSELFLWRDQPINDFRKQLRDAASNYSNPPSDTDFSELKKIVSELLAN